MAQQYSYISDLIRQFIEKQKVFFVATAMETGHINVSPKGMDSLRVLGPNRVVWLNVTGSGNETATHVQHSPRMTLMFCAFEGTPSILRLYGESRVIHVGEMGWKELAQHFPSIPGARQIFDVQISLVQTSCGMAVPLFDYVEDRDLLWNWAEKKGEQGIHTYWEEKNQTSIDGVASNILEKARIE
ncbi:MAG: pyridoxamine 5'-phosphate oxidase family protein [Gammaproteobacteria bacterium]|nr:pyridoxamine 5'-phosphate oxidase family protein [Gammaproteobacteria bacterium]